MAMACLGLVVSCMRSCGAHLRGHDGDGDGDSQWQLQRGEEDRQGAQKGIYAGDCVKELSN